MPLMRDAVPESGKPFTMVAVCAACGYEVFAMRDGDVTSTHCLACKMLVLDKHQVPNAVWAYFDTSYADLNQRELVGRLMQDCERLGAAKSPLVAMQARIETLKNAVLERMN